MAGTAGRRLRRAIVLALLLVLTMIHLPVVHASSGSPQPQLLSVSAPARAILGPDSGDTWTVTASTSDDQPLTQVSMVFSLDGRRGQIGEVPRLYAAFNGSSGTGGTNTTVTVTGTSGHWQAGGDYQLQEITLYDGLNRQSSWTRGGPGPDLSEADVTVDNPHGDGTPPDASELHLLSPPEETAGLPVIVGYNAHDDLSGVANVNLQYNSPNNTGLYLTPIPGSAATGPAAGQLPLNAVGGDWTLVSVVVYDQAGNSRYYSPSSPGGLNFAAMTLHVTAPAPDTTTPTLRSLTANPRNTSPGGDYGFDYTSDDDSSGVVQVFATYSDPSGSGSFVTGRLCADAAAGNSGQDFPPSAPAGVYTLQQVSVMDGVNNSTQYLRDGRVYEHVGNTDPTLATDKPHIDLAAGDVTVSAGASPVAPSHACPVASVVSLLNKTATGVVTAFGAPVPNPEVSVYAPAGAGQTHSLGIVRGDSSGHFSVGSLPPGSVVHFFGARSVRGSLAPPADSAIQSATDGAAAGRLSGRPGVVRRYGALRLSTRSFAAGTGVYVNGVNTRPGDKVQVQTRRGKGWQTVGTRRLDAHGHTSFLIRRSDRRAYRVALPATAFHTQAAASVLGRRRS